MGIDVNLRIFSFKRKIILSKEWIRFGIVSLVVLATLALAYWGSSRIMILLLVLLGAIAGVPFLLKQPNLGIILIIVGGMLVPYSGPAGVNMTVFAVALSIGVWLMNMLVIQKEVKFIRSQAFLPVIVMFVISVIAFGMGQIPWFVFANQAPLDAQVGGFAIFVLSLGCTLVTAHLVQDIRWLKIIVWVYIGLSAIYVFGRLVGLPVDRIYQIGLVSGSMFWTWLVVLTFAQAFFNNKLRLPVRSLLYGVVLITMYVAYVRGNDWKSGWVPAAVAIAVMIGLRYKRLFLLAIPIALIVAGNLAVRLIASDEYSWGTRIDAWQIVLEISRVNPLFGLGFSNYYWYTPLIPIRGWVVNFNSHSQYIDLIAQVGILGLFCFLWIFFEVLKLSWKLIKNKHIDGFAGAYTYGVLAGTTATLVAAFLGDWVLPFVYNVGLTGFRASILPWLFVGGMIAIERMYEEKS
jgi:O-antigen ligase